MSFKGFPKINHESLLQRFKDNLKGQSASKDDRFFRLSKDDSNQGIATIRFLPGKIVDGKEQLNYKLFFRHNLKLKGKQGYYNCICPTSVGLQCPICDWNKMQEGDFVYTNGFYRQKKYLSNIIVVEEKNEEQVGKVKIFEYGRQIMDILESALYPKGLKKKSPLFYYDWEEGANFELVLSKSVDSTSWPSWKESEFLAPSSIMEIIEAYDLDPNEVVKSLFDLDEVVDNLDILSYDTIKREFNSFLGSVGLPSDGSVEVGDISEGKVTTLQAVKRNALEEAIERQSEEEYDDEEADRELEEVMSRPKTSAIAKKKVVVEEENVDEDGDAQEEAKPKKEKAKMFKDFIDKSKWADK